MAGKGRTSIFIALLKPLRVERSEYVRDRIETFDVLDLNGVVIGRFELFIEYRGPRSWEFTMSGWYRNHRYSDTSEGGFNTAKAANEAMRKRAISACAGYVKTARAMETRRNDRLSARNSLLDD